MKMRLDEINHYRLTQQGITGNAFPAPTSLLRHLICIQAQDFAAAKWAIGTRIKDITEEQVDQDFNAGKILRTHILRPTWHFVLPEDIHWLLELTAPRIKTLCLGMHRKLEIDPASLKRSRQIIAKALHQYPFLDRKHLKAFLKNGKINTDETRLTFLLMNAELDGIICSGPRFKNQFTYRLLDKLKVNAKRFTLSEGLGELGKRYFASRGPATVRDFAWWSGLNLSDAKKSVEMNRGRLDHENLGSNTYWFSSDLPSPSKIKSVHLLPAFDEYGVAYKDRAMIINPAFIKESGNGIFKPSIIVDGEIAGTWMRTIIKNEVIIEFKPFGKISKRTERLLHAASKNFAAFTGKSLVTR